MSIKGSPSNNRCATKGGSLPNGRSIEFDRRSVSAGTLRDNDPGSFLRKIVVDLFQKQRTEPAPTVYVNGHQKLGASNGNGALLDAPHELAILPYGKVPAWKSVLDITLIILTLPLWRPLMLVL